MVDGVYAPDALNPGRRPDENVPDRSTLGWARDTAIDTVRGVGKAIAGVPAIASDVGPADEQGRPFAYRQQEGMRAADELLGGLKTAKGQFKERTGRDDSGLAQKAVEAIATNIPQMVVGAATGGWGAAAMYAAQSYGDPRNESEEKIYGSTEDALAKDNPKYVGLRQKGMSDAEARHQLYSDSFDPIAQAINTTLGGAGGYGLSRLAGATMMRSTAEKMVDRLSKRVVVGGLEGGASIGAMSGAGEYARQSAAVGGGFRDKMDPDAILKATLEGGELGTVLGGVSGIPRRGPPGGAKPKDVKPAEPLAADVMATAAEQLRPHEPADSDWGGLQKYVDEQTQEPSPMGPEGPLGDKNAPGEPLPRAPGEAPPAPPEPAITPAEAARQRERRRHRAPTEGCWADARRVTGSSQRSREPHVTRRGS
jgi:hypothetical protein